MGDDADQRIRLVVLGGGGVGKTAIIKRFLFNTFDEKYRSTVEDLYYREYDIGSITIKVDILDTAGDLQFPAMRRLSIATAGAFLLVYSVTCSTSLSVLKQCFEEIRENRSDFQEIPMMVVGNKADMDDTRRQITKEDVSEWVYCELPRIRAKVLECSAKTSFNINEVFKSFLQLAKFPTTSDDSGLKRRSSAYGSVKTESRLSPTARRDSLTGAAGESSDAAGNKLKPRSRSLIRRSSRKAAKIRDAAASTGSTSEDCNVS